MNKSKVTKSKKPQRSIVDVESLMSIKSLELRSRVVVEGFWSGLHRSPYHGFSVEFTEYRQYTPGDDTRFLDWKLFARSDRFYIKKFEDETNLMCHLLLDCSASMGYGSLSYTKWEYVQTLAATLGHFLYSQRDAVGLVNFDSEVNEYLPARYRFGHLRRFTLAIDHQAIGKTTNLHPPIEHIAQLIKKRGIVVLISDFLTPLDDLRNKLPMLTAKGHEVIAFQVLDPQEVAFEFDDPVQMVDSETKKRKYIDPRSQRAQYQEKIQAHNAELVSILEKNGVAFRRLLTNQPLNQALLDLLKSRVTQRATLSKTATNSKARSAK